MRKFEIVTRYSGSAATLPTRATAGSAGYDFHPCEHVELRPYETKLVHTGVKCRMERGDVLLLFVRSSIGIKKHITLANGTGVIDADYYNNPDNEGEIMLALTNNGNEFWEAYPRDRIAQGVFVKYAVTDDDTADGDRKGGIGSTNAGSSIR